MSALALAVHACAPSSGSSADPGAGPNDATADAGEVAPIESEPDASTTGPASDARAADDAPEQFSRAGVTLGLWPDECLLVAETQTIRVEHRFEFPDACHFVSESEGGPPQAVATEYGPALMVVGSKALDDGCDTALRVVLLHAEGPRVSRGVQRVAACGPGAWDEMMYHVLASEPVEFGTPADE